MPTFNDLKSLEAYVNKMTKEAMVKGNAVKNTVIEAGKRHVQEDVYDVYTPNPNNPNSYKRTGELKNNWKVEETSEGISVFNDRRDGEKYVAEVVEYGKGYDYDFEYSNTPRPFTENTRQELASGNELSNAMKKDLMSIGFDVE